MTRATVPYTPFPTGWFRAARSDSLRIRGVLSVSWLGEELVLFRGEDGAARAIPAHCPHLGADLGQGGRVVGNTIECPFHHWRLDGDGRCVSVSGGRVPEARNAARRFPVCERNGAVMVWFDAPGRAPLWDVPALPEVADPEWTRLRPARGATARTHVQEVCENGVDLAHFTVVHGHQIEAARTAGFACDGPRLRHRISTTLRLSGLSRRLRRETTGSLEFEYHGLGMVVCRAQVVSWPFTSFLTVIYPLPREGGEVSIEADVAIRRQGMFTPLLRVMATREAERAFADDAAVLSHKAYLARPLLNDADGPIMLYRKWARQFYPMEAASVA